MTVSGEGFPASTSVDVLFDGVVPGVTSLADPDGLTTDAEGRVSFVFTYPDASEGTHAVTLRVGDVEASAELLVEAEAVAPPTPEPEPSAEPAPDPTPEPSDGPGLSPTGGDDPAAGAGILAAFLLLGIGMVLVARARSRST